MSRYELRHKTAKTEFLQEELEVHGGGYKTFCTTSVLAVFGIAKDSFRFCQFTQDVVRILRKNKWSVRKQKINCTVEELQNEVSPGHYFVTLETHVMLAYIGANGYIQWEQNTYNDKYLIQPIEELFRISRR